MVEKTVEEMLQEEIPVTGEASEEASTEETSGSDAAADTDSMDADQEESGEAAEEETSEGEASGDDLDPDETGEDKKGFFKKLKKGDKEKTALQEKIEALEDRVKRQMAEFDNFRKRTEKEKQQMFSMGERNAIEKMLPIVDNFERGLATVPEEEKDGPLASGMEMVYRQLLKQLEAMGVAPIEAVGKEFDPAFHNAVMQVESDEYPSGTVAQEFQKGYTYHGTVIRYSMVGVVQ
ncbi:molecular chaperone GrpE [Sarcina sp. DSM 11001]|uniref:nucleotide exchange factor GrpE n=1 Tax=Sarcina sp. DSM 11001 TaxID=1798184 RepID=UPI000891C6AE|nr:nucleotide exchange factor GrpE [Sarcina sp. DSM 11001]SDK38570.1 molecular chaperone GrpE [Sarcina sp. DSM 11001]